MLTSPSCRVDRVSKVRNVVWEEGRPTISSFGREDDLAESSGFDLRLRIYAHTSHSVLSFPAQSYQTLLRLVARSVKEKGKQP